MAKVVIAGIADCPHYAEVQLLAEHLTNSLNDFKIHKICKLPHEWNSWLQQTCGRYGWGHTKSPLIWRELVHRDGKPLLIGGASEFFEYVDAYYGIQSLLDSDHLMQVATENSQLADELAAEKLAAEDADKPIQVSISSSASPLACHIISMIASGQVFGSGVKVHLNLFDADTSVLSALATEVMHLASGSVHQPPAVTSDMNQFLTGSDVILLLDDVTMEEGDSRADWLRRVYSKFSSYAHQIDAVCRRDVSIVVPAINSAANFIGGVISRCAPNILPENIIVTSRLVENLAKSAISRRSGVNGGSIVDLIVWGDSSGMKPSRFAVDVSRAKVYDCDSSAVYGPQYFYTVENVVHDRQWLQHDLPAIISSSSSSSSEGDRSVISTACAVTSFLSDWWLGNCSSQRLHSVAVRSQGWYSVPEGLYFSFPVQLSSARYYNVVEDLLLSRQLEAKLSRIITELKNDMEVVFPGSKKKKVRKIKVKFDVTADDALLSNETLPSNEMAAVSATDSSDGVTGDGGDVARQPAMTSLPSHDDADDNNDDDIEVASEKVPENIKNEHAATNAAAAVVAAAAADDDDD